MTPLLLLGDARRAQLCRALERQVADWWSEWMGAMQRAPSLTLLEDARPHSGVEQRLAVALRIQHRVVAVSEASPSILGALQPAWYSIDGPSTSGSSSVGAERSIVGDMLAGLLKGLSPATADVSIEAGVRSVDAFADEPGPLIGFRLSIAPPWHEVRCWIGADLVDALLGPRPAPPAIEDFMDRRDCLGDCEVTVEGVVGDARVGWAELKSLQVGDVVVTDALLDAPVSLTVYGRAGRLGRGALGQMDGRRVIRIESGAREA